MLPALLTPGVVESFPDPCLADQDGLVAVGGDLSRERLLLAYDQGIFPWYNEGTPELWWSPDPRAVLLPDDLHVSRSMQKMLAKSSYEVTLNKSFTEVMRGCSECRVDGTWILPEMIEAYSALNASGDAHSVEVWEEGCLVGGIYGVQRGALFAGESMFHRRDNASKIALIILVRSLAAVGVELIDVQMMTSHLSTMGAVIIPRSDYVARIASLTSRSVCLDCLVAGD